jgi:hypothetical protein
MEIKYGVTGKDRKALVIAIAWDNGSRRSWYSDKAFIVELASESRADSNNDYANQEFKLGMQDLISLQLRLQIKFYDGAKFEVATE